MDKKLFYYDLPEEYIAQEPLEKRDHAKMLVLKKQDGSIYHDYFYNIKNYLKKNDVLVLNESKVIKCRLKGLKETTNANIECFILNKINYNTANVLLKPAKRLKKNDRVFIGNFYFVVNKKLDYGKAIVEFSDDIDTVIEKHGKIPLPPYIKNKNINYDRYQTVYADKDGSTAAPTAGFHFTNELINDLEKNGIIFAKLRLDIGLDTFRPITEDDIEKHKIHSEYYSISEKEVEKILNAKKRGGRIIAVGTTSTRVLETIALEKGKLTACSGQTSLYIYPGFKFQLVQAMITNFHLPCSTLLVMVSAFAGRENILQAYEEAKQKNYRFYSFGDCMFIY